MEKVWESFKFFVVAFRDAAIASCKDDQVNGRWIIFLAWSGVILVFEVIGLGTGSVFDKIYYLGAGLAVHWMLFDWEFGREKPTTVTIDAVMEDE